LFERTNISQKNNSIEKKLFKGGGLPTRASSLTHTRKEAKMPRAIATKERVHRKIGSLFSVDWWIFLE